MFIPRPKTGAKTSEGAVDLRLAAKEYVDRNGIMLWPCMGGNVRFSQHHNRSSAFFLSKVMSVRANNLCPGSACGV